MAGLVLRLGAGLVVAGGGALLATKLADVLQQARQRVQLGRTPCGNPLPREVHAVLPADETANKRIIIVGDIHGCAGGCGLGTACVRLLWGRRRAWQADLLHIVAPHHGPMMPCQCHAIMPCCTHASLPCLPCHAMPQHVSLSLPRRALHADELEALLQKLGYRRGEDLLLSVGDLVNKGPDSEKVRF